MFAQFGQNSIEVEDSKRVLSQSATLPQADLILSRPQS
jgi:hypothetical protein